MFSRWCVNVLVVCKRIEREPRHRTTTTTNDQQQRGCGAGLAALCFTAIVIFCTGKGAGGVCVGRPPILGHTTRLCGAFFPLALSLCLRLSLACASWCNVAGLSTWKTPRFWCEKKGESGSRVVVVAFRNSSIGRFCCRFDNIYLALSLSLALACVCVCVSGNDPHSMAQKTNESTGHP